MKHEKREIFFFFFIFVSSIIFIQFDGFYFPSKNQIDLLKFSFEPAQNLKYHDTYSNKDQKQKITFKGGYGYSHYKEGNHSDFYDGNISMIKNSPYWRFPENILNADLYIIEGSNSNTLNLVLKERNHLPVISLICNTDDFFSYNKGIYVEGFQADFFSSKRFYPFPWHKPANYYVRKEDKRKAHMSLYNTKGKLNFESFVWVEINGNATRCFPQKSLRVSNASIKGNSEIDTKLFNKSYETIILRNGGNDNIKSFFRDMLMQELMKNTEVLISDFVPCEMYLNGMYWGIYIIQNRFDRDFISKANNCRKRKVSLMENWISDKGNQTFQDELLAISKNKNMDYKSILEIIDEKSLIDYLIGELFFANTDWPENNLKLYHIDNKESGKWKFAFFDLDYGMGYAGIDNVELDMFAHLNKKSDPFSRMFKTLMNEKSFKTKFKSRFYELLNSNLSEKNMISLIDKLERTFEGTMEKQAERWGKPESVSEWKLEVENLRQFAQKRHSYIHDHINQYLK